MKLFHWPLSDALANYSCGDIIVMAVDLETARLEALSYAHKYLKAYYSWWFNPEGKLDKEYVDDFNEWIQKFSTDLLKEPDVVDHPIFIKGSE